MCRNRHIRDEGGYTLLETIFQVMIFIMFAQLFLLFFYWKAPIERQYMNRSAVQWEMFAADIQDELINLSSIEMLRMGEGIRFQTDRGIITIEERNQVIRKTVGGQGHIPFLTEVASAMFKLEEPTLYVKITMLDGTQKERDFTIGHYPK